MSIEHLSTITQLQITTALELGSVVTCQAALPLSNVLILELPRSLCSSLPKLAPFDLRALEARIRLGLMVLLVDFEA
jgi:hypothetical protein